MTSQKKSFSFFEADPDNSIPLSFLCTMALMQNMILKKHYKYAIYWQNTFTSIYERLNITVINIKHKNKISKQNNKRTIKKKH